MKQHVVCLLVLLAASAAASEPSVGQEGRAREAVEIYTRALDTPDRDARLADFRRAEHLFDSIAATGARNPELYTNLGNAALLSEDLGAAVLAYRRALRLDPDHPRALQNLAHTRLLLPGWVPKPEPPGLLDSFFFWHHTLPSSTRGLAASLCFAAAALLFAASIRWRQAALRSIALLPALAWLGLLGSLVIEAREAEAQAAVVTASEAVARSADSALAPAALPEPLPAGTEVEIVGHRSPWLRVRLANGRDAWLPESGVSPVVEAPRPATREEAGSPQA